jgi:hypothetical protein
MKYALGSILILASVIGAFASPTQNVLSFSRPRPLVIWHGLGTSTPSLFPKIGGPHADGPAPPFHRRLI